MSSQSEDNNDEVNVITTKIESKDPEIRRREHSLHPPYEWVQGFTYLLILWNLLSLYLNFEIFFVSIITKVFKLINSRSFC